VLGTIPAASNRSSTAARSAIRLCTHGRRRPLAVRAAFSRGHRHARPGATERRAPIASARISSPWAGHAEEAGTGDYPVRRTRARPSARPTGRSWPEGRRLVAERSARFLRDMNAILSRACGTRSASRRHATGARSRCAASSTSASCSSVRRSCSATWTSSRAAAICSRRATTTCSSTSSRHLPRPVGAGLAARAGVGGRVGPVVEAAATVHASIFRRRGVEAVDFYGFRDADAAVARRRRDSGSRRPSARTATAAEHRPQFPFGAGAAGIRERPVPRDRGRCRRPSRRVPLRRTPTRFRSQGRQRRPAGNDAARSHRRKTMRVSVRRRRRPTIARLALARR